MVEREPRDTGSNLPKGEYNRATSEQLEIARQYLDQISGSLRRANESIESSQFIIDALPIAVSNLLNEIRGLDREKQQSVVPTRERNPETQLKPGKSKQVKSSQPKDLGWER